MHDLTGHLAPPQAAEAVLAKEAARQDAVDAYKLIDTLNETAYDDITRLAAGICGTRMAALSIIDGDRHLFRARRGSG